MPCQSLSLAMCPLRLCRAWGMAGCRALQHVLCSKISAHTLNARVGEADMCVLIATLNKQTPRGVFFWVLCSSQCMLHRASVSCARRLCITKYFQCSLPRELDPASRMHWLPMRTTMVFLLLEQVQKSESRKGGSQARAQDHFSVLPTASRVG